MTELDYRPNPGAASPTQRVFAHARLEAKLLITNGEQLLLALVIPVGLLVAGRLFGPAWLPFDTIAPSVLALAIWSTCFTSLAIATGFERRYGVLERLAATPLGRTGLVLGKASAIAAVTAGQLVVLAVLALVLGWRPDGAWGAWLVAAATAGVGALAFASLALAMAGALRAEITLALANLVYLVGLSLGGIMIPLSVMPDAMAAVVRFLPTAALAETLRDASAGAFGWLGLGIVCLWALAGIVTARRVFRWTS